MKSKYFIFSNIKNNKNRAFPCLGTPGTYNCVIECTVEGDFVPRSDEHPGRGVSSDFHVDENVLDDSVHLGEQSLILAESQDLAVRHRPAISCIHVTPVRSDQPSAVPQGECVRCILENGFQEGNHAINVYLNLTEQ